MDDWREILEVFDECYEYLYDCDVNDTLHPRIRAALTAHGDTIIHENGELIREFARYRGDMFTSDREVQALAMTFCY